MVRVCGGSLRRDFHVPEAVAAMGGYEDTLVARAEECVVNRGV